MLRSRSLLVAFAAGMVLSVPASADADVYSVFSCRDPLGPVNDAVGWVGTRSGTGQVVNACSAGGALSAILGRGATRAPTGRSARAPAPASRASPRGARPQARPRAWSGG